MIFAYHISQFDLAVSAVQTPLFQRGVPHSSRAASNKQLKELILRYTNELPPQQKLVFTLRDVEELEVAEVQIITGLSPEKIKSTLYLARKNIRNKMNQIDPDL